MASTGGMRRAAEKEGAMSQQRTLVSERQRQSERTKNPEGFDAG